MSGNFRTSSILSILIAIFATAASAGGVFLKNLYRDNLFVTSVWKGNDAVTLFVIVPVLVFALILTRRGSRRGQLIWLWQRRPWGYVIAAIMAVKGSLYMLSLAAASVSSMVAGFQEAAAEIPL